MPVIVIPELPEDEWDLEQWREMVANDKPGGPGAHSLQSSEASLVIRTEANKVRSCLRQLLGWAWADDEAPWRLHREACPVQHPRYPWLWCDGVSEIQRFPIPQLQTDGTRKAKEDGYGFGGYAPEQTAKYGIVEITVRFRNILWRQYTDADPTWAANYVGMEWLRSFGTAGKAAMLDLVSAEGATDESALYFAEGDAGNGPTSGPNGQPFGGTQYTKALRCDFKTVWRCVPINYACGALDVSDENNIQSVVMPYPERLIKALGCVNSVPFPGTGSRFKAGTLLLKSVEETPYQLPVQTSSEFGLLCADYLLTFEHFDPPRDPSAVQNLGTSGAVAVKYGHHLYPYRPSGWYWYYATSGSDTKRGTYQGNALLREIDFHSLFRHISDPAYPIP